MTGGYIVASGGSDPAGLVGGFFIWAIIFAMYWIPSIVGGMRHVRNLGSVVVINFFLGWTLIGWVIALAMACRSAEPRRQAYAPPGAPPPNWQQPPGPMPSPPPGQPQWPQAPSR